MSLGYQKHLLMNTFDTRAIRTSFGRAAAHYERTAVLQREVETHLLENLEYVKQTPSCVVDVGAGPGYASSCIKKRWPKAQVLAVDAAIPMLKYARKYVRWFRRFHRVAADAYQLPIREASMDVLFSNLCIQWCTDLPVVFQEFRRVLRPNGMVLLSTFGPGTLKELRAAWSEVDGSDHVSHFPDMPVIGDALQQAGFRDLVLDIDTYTLTYVDARTLMRELKTIGASNASMSRSRSLRAKSQLVRLEQAYETHRVNGRLPATYEVISVLAFASDAVIKPVHGDGVTAAFSVDHLRGSRIQR